VGLLDGKVGLVTGAGGGIGRATALTFAREGAAVAVADVDAQGGEETVRLVLAQGGRARFLRADVSDEAQVEAMVR
jgi:NAD(P)-dependent dehydrogenase (short-subunit alcohol dehydrogenase family)